VAALGCFLKNWLENSTAGVTVILFPGAAKRCTGWEFFLKKNWKGKSAEMRTGRFCSVFRYQALIFTMNIFAFAIGRVEEAALVLHKLVEVTPGPFEPLAEIIFEGVVHIKNFTQNIVHKPLQKMVERDAVQPGGGGSCCGPEFAPFSLSQVGPTLVFIRFCECGRAARSGLDRFKRILLGSHRLSSG
jgi:hypothetical protein